MKFERAATRRGNRSQESNPRASFTSAAAGEVAVVMCAPHCSMYKLVSIAKNLRLELPPGRGPLLGNWVTPAEARGVNFAVAHAGQRKVSPCGVMYACAAMTALLTSITDEVPNARYATAPGIAEIRR